MLKKFLITLLGSVTGVWIAFGIAFFAFFGLIGAMIGDSGAEPPALEKHSALHINLSGNMPERYQPGDIWQILRDSESDGDALVDILAAIRMAATDSKIDGIYITAPMGASSGAGVAAREEIVQALREFKKSGKWIVSYADSYSQGDYTLACLADSIFLNPSGSLDIHGVASQVPFFKEVMDKLGVNMQIVRVGTYKSAVEPFMGTEMSPASRLQTQVMLDSIWNYLTGVYTSARPVKTAAVNMWADSVIATWPAKDVLAAKAVTALRYRRQADDAVRDLCGLDEDDDLRLITPTDYMAVQKSFSADKKHVAVLVAAGDIVDAGEGGIVAESLVPEILSLADDDNVRALVMRVNSGGGSAFASEQIWEAFEYFKEQGKPFYVSMGDYAASGGYYISCGADKIYADRTTLTGSIGVFGMIPDVHGLVTDKLGIHFGTVATNPAGTLESPYKALTPSQLAALQRSVDDIYDQFTSRVAQGRGIPQDSVKVIAEGRVWTGGAARSLGLVDEIGGLRQAIVDIAAEADIDPDHIVFYPDVQDEFLNQILRQARGNVTIGNATVSPETLRLLRMLDYLRSMPRVQARMEPIEIR